MHRLALSILFLLASAGAVAAAPTWPERPHTTFCQLVEASASDHGLPVEFFTRLIWQESSFRAEAVSPKGAQGIAQFMPVTAAERGLADPFDPHQAIPASARLLSDLRAQFGNLGLAAAAYNAGAARVSNWLSGVGGLPLETRSYVAAITGRPVEHWSSQQEVKAEPDRPDEQELMACRTFVALLRKPPALPPPGKTVAPQPWGVQLAGSFSQERALRSYRGLQKLYPAILGGREPVVLRRQNRSRGTKAMVHIRIPAATREAANHLCWRLRAKGGACIVLRN